MHLSLLSDGYLSDSLADAASFSHEGHGRAHRDGLLRGLLFAAALVLPLGLTIALSPREAEKASSPTAATDLRVTHLHMS